MIENLTENFMRKQSPIWNFNQTQQLWCRIFCLLIQNTKTPFFWKGVSYRFCGCDAAIVSFPSWTDWIGHEMARKALTVMRTKQNKTFEVLPMFRTCPNKLNCLKERRKTPKKNVISSGRIKFQLWLRNYHYYSSPQNNLQPAKAFLRPKIILFWGLHLEIIIITQMSETQTIRNSCPPRVLALLLLFLTLSEQWQKTQSKKCRKGSMVLLHSVFPLLSPSSPL